MLIVFQILVHVTLEVLFIIGVYIPVHLIEVLNVSNADSIIGLISLTIIDILYFLHSSQCKGSFSAGYKDYQFKAVE